MCDAGARSYETHFYCALCGGPFAKVFRTAVPPAPPNNIDYDHELYGGRSTDGTDTSLENEFNLDPEDNRILPEEFVLNNMSHAAKRSRALRLRAEKEGFRRGMMGEQRTTWHAYDGKLISTQQMKWTKSLRALISRKANRQPFNHDRYLNNGRDAYLTGRGLIRQSQNWADAFASIEEDEGHDESDGSDVHTEFPVFSDEEIKHHTYGFNVYQELGRSDARYVISSIPFHDECWTMLDLAIEEAGKERGIDEMNERIKMDDLWGYLRGLVGMTGVMDSSIVPQSTWAALLEERRVDGIVTRLGEVDYREGQAAGEGWQWKHEEGLHWLVADPSSISVLNSPLLPVVSKKPLPCAPRAALMDPFQSLPPEIILEICTMLTSTDIFGLKTATPAAHNLGLPDSFYRRFLQEEFKYLPTLVKEVGDYETLRERKELDAIDWRGSFERLRRLMMVPKDGEGWESVDIGLKNRNRIWKIVKPMADHFVESSPALLLHRYSAPVPFAERTRVVRGYVGVRTGRQGLIESVYFGPRTRVIDPDIKDEAGDPLREDLALTLDVVRVWLDGEGGPLCGLGFFVTSEDQEVQRWERFGRRGSFYVDVKIGSRVLTGFVFCLHNHIVCGVQLVFNNDTLFSEKHGCWNGVARKITAPSRYRNLVGVIGFVNSGGFIETLGILEETPEQHREDAIGPLAAPPQTVDLSHAEASVWKRLPPPNVKLLEREGPHIMDWRMCRGEWEIWANGFHEEGAKEPPGKDRTLLEIVGYYDDTALRGLEFVYREHSSNKRVASILGSKQAKEWDSIGFKEGESVAAVVICYSDACVHGILFVTGGGRTSEVFGPRYLGIHKVFAPTANVDGPSQTIFRKETTGDIIGLHCLYDEEGQKFLQLGLMLLIDDDKIYETELPHPIPFSDLDSKLQVWDDGPPPEDWSIASRPGEMGIFTRDFAPAQFSGWIALSSLRRVTIYGRMKGVRFSFEEGKDRFFGYVRDVSNGVYVQEIGYENGERVTGIVVVREDPTCSSPGEKPGSRDSIESTSTNGDEQQFLDRIYLLTNWNEGELSLPVKYRVSSPYLVAIKFDFSYHQLISWAPIYAPDPDVPVSQKLISEMLQFPWKCRLDDITADRKIKPTSRVACIFFDEEEGKRIDAVKGYVGKSGDFCGLLFRREGDWESNVFGHRSAYELTFELMEGERFTSIFFPERDLKALALCTNRGRTTPWFGRGSKRVILREPPRGLESVGIYGTLDRQIEYYEETIDWGTIGLLCRPDQRCPTARPKTHGQIPPPITQYPQSDPQLPWFSNLQALPTDVWLSPLVAQREGQYVGKPGIGRAYSLFDPAQLDQIVAHVNLSHHAGIKSLRFCGTSRMGLVTLGEWPEREDVKIKGPAKMRILGPTGERIEKVKVAFQRLDQQDLVVGLSMETNFGRLKKVFSSELCLERPIRLSPHNVKSLECTETEEIVGFHGIVSDYNIHDLGLVLRRIPKLSSH
ncbi:hypothetical protein L873DRAFT_1668292 [Choiromyces venosus 120613-1]|uniref:F-box domain-containing protein n=1 Tax=Choiromyces venosus 120613-1 TaxID=1336337 RepID=A0A3N4K3Y7_9PEZI|nr:hypothetical protein L873DRAFT_1668292 [Choiromyces venosus 120613-1]